LRRFQEGKTGSDTSQTVGATVSGCPSYIQLADGEKMNNEIVNILKKLKTEFEKLYQSRLVTLILFGSQARGDAESGSDIDVLVVLKGTVQVGTEVKRTGQIIADLSLQHDEVINCIFMEEDYFLNRQGPLLRNIRKEGILL
jgi:predicted nucleotidyltransferase